jgi:hypothetical protein
VSHTTDRDLGYKRFVKQYSSADGAHVTLGFQGNRAVKEKKTRGENASKKKSTVVEVAAAHEFGAPSKGLPERSFLRSTHDRTIRDRTAFVVVLLRAICDGKLTVSKALALMGVYGVRGIKETIRKSIGIKPLAESTKRWKNRRQIAKAVSRINQLEQILHKRDRLTPSQLKSENKASELILTGGRSTPLIDTGQMINSITFARHMKGSDGSEEGGGDEA